MGLRVDADGKRQRTVCVCGGGCQGEEQTERWWWDGEGTDRAREEADGGIRERMDRGMGWS